jgi:hypothetical protein
MVQRRRCRFCLFLSGLILTALGLHAGAAKAAAQESRDERLTGQQVVDRMVESNVARAAALERYRGRRTYRIEYAGFPKNVQAEMVVDVIYQAPATKTFTVVSEKGSSVLVNRVLKRLLATEQESMQGDNLKKTALNRENYNFTPIEGQDASEECPYVFAVEPKVASKLLYRGKIWISAGDFAMCRLEAEPAKRPDFLVKQTTVHQTYAKVAQFWLPMLNRSVATIRLGGTATLTIAYQDYEILAARPMSETVSGGPQ